MKQASFEPIPPGLLDPTAHVDADGCVAATRTMALPMLQAAYAHGVFPWTDAPVRWFCPAARGLLVPERAHFPRNLPRLMRRAGLEVRVDTAFAAVVRACARAHAHEGTWITARFEQGYAALHAAGAAHSVEVFADDALVGGLYGVQVGGMFCAESMFMAVSPASRAAVYALVTRRAELGVALIDVQQCTPTTQALGAIDVPRALYLQLLARCRPMAVPPGAWTPRSLGALGAPKAGAARG